jgi:hypothetical protein
VEQAKWTGEYVDNHVQDAIKWSKEKYNLQMFEFPAAEKAEIPKLLDPIIKAYVKKVTDQGMPGEQIVKDALALKAKYEK